jgi:phage I-like protein
MKKFIALVTVVFCCSMTTLIAQGGGGQQMTPEQRMERMKTMYKPQLTEKAKITDTEADKVIEILADIQPKMRPIMMDQAMSQEDKDKKMAKLNVDRDKRLKAIPLSDDQVKAVVTTIDEIRKNMQNRPRGGGGR